MISHRLPARITSDCDLKRKLENKTKRSRNKGATTLISTISTCKTMPNSNFCFSELEGSDVHPLLLKLVV